MNNTDDKYTVHSPTKVTWGPDAEESRRQYGMSRIEWARYLLARHKERAAAGENQ